MSFPEITKKWQWQFFAQPQILSGAEIGPVVKALELQQTVTARQAPFRYTYIYHGYETTEYKHFFNAFMIDSQI